MKIAHLLVREIIFTLVIEDDPLFITSAPKMVLKSIVKAMIYRATSYSRFCEDIPRKNSISSTKIVLIAIITMFNF